LQPLRDPFHHHRRLGVQVRRQLGLLRLCGGRIFLLTVRIVSIWFVVQQPPPEKKRPLRRFFDISGVQHDPPSLGSFGGKRGSKWGREARRPKAGLGRALRRGRGFSTKFDQKNIAMAGRLGLPFFRT